MGQSASTSATTTKTSKRQPGSLLPSDVFDLTDEEITTLWKDHPLTAAEIHPFVPKPTPKHCDDKAASGVHFYTNSNDTSSSSRFTGTRTTKDMNNEECPREMALAVRLLRIPALAKLRFKLVPSKMKEHVFWQAILAWLKDRLVTYNAKLEYRQQFPDEQEWTENGGDGRSSRHENGGQHFDENNNKAPNRHAITTSKEESLQKLVQAKNVQIDALQEEIRKLKQSLATSQHINGTRHHHHHHPSRRKTHKGQWKIDKDSQEFLNYPDEIKESLRQEKQRRLQQVQEELKFIVDSDDIQHTNGKWECCGETEYHAHCSM